MTIKKTHIGPTKLSLLDVRFMSQVQTTMQVHQVYAYSNSGLNAGQFLGPDPTHVLELMSDP